MIDYREDEHGGQEPSPGSVGRHDQRHRCAGSHSDREIQHDGREPEDWSDIRLLKRWVKDVCDHGNVGATLRCGGTSETATLPKKLHLGHWAMETPNSFRGPSFNAGREMRPRGSRIVQGRFRGPRHPLLGPFRRCNLRSSGRAPFTRDRRNSSDRGLLGGTADTIRRLKPGAGGRATAPSYVLRIDECPDASCGHT